MNLPIVVTTVIEKPREVLWELFTDSKHWAEWYGGALESVQPSWQEGAELRWAKGAPSTIAALVRLEKVVMRSPSGLRTLWNFKDIGNGRTEVMLANDYNQSTLHVADPGAVEAQLESTLADFKRYSTRVAQQGKK